MKALWLIPLVASVAVAQTGGSNSIPLTPIRTFAPAQGNGPETLQDKPVPAFSFNMVEGSKLTEKSLLGKVVLIDFWATWCPPCKLTSPILQGLIQKYGKRGFEIIGADTREQGADGKPARDPHFARDYAAEHKYTYNFAWGTDDVMTAWHVHGIPTMFLIDRKGVVRFVQVGYFDGLQAALEHAIEPLLGAAK